MDPWGASLFLLAKQEGSEVSIHLAKANLANPHFQTFITKEVEGPFT